MSTLAGSCSILLTVLPYTVHIGSIPCSSISQVSHALLRLVLSLADAGFLSITRSQSEQGPSLSLIMSSKALKILGPEALSESSTQKWKPIIVSEGAVTGEMLVHSVSRILAKAGFSILFVSAHSTDYVLVMKEDLEEALECLKSDLEICVEVEDAEETRKLEELDDAEVTEVLRSIKLKKSLLSASFEKEEVAQDLSNSHLSLILLPERIVIQQILAEEIEVHLPELLRSLFLSESGFLSVFYHDSLSIMKEAPEETSEPVYRSLCVKGEFGFYETGLVYSLSAPLAAVGIPCFYLSIFSTDFIMIEEEKMEQAKHSLRKKFEIFEKIH